MGRKKKRAERAANEAADDAAELTRKMFEGIDDEYADAEERAKREIEAARVAVKWAHSRFAAAAGNLAGVVEDVYRGHDRLTPEDVGVYLKETTRRLKRLKAMIAIADDVFEEVDEKLGVLGGVDGLDV